MAVVEPDPFDVKRPRQFKNRLGVRTFKAFNGDPLHASAGFQDIAEIGDVENLFGGDEQPGFAGGKSGQIADIDVFSDQIGVKVVFG